MFSSPCVSILGDAWMVHHEWRQRGSIRVQETATIPGGLSVSRFHRCFIELVSIAVRRASFPSLGSRRSNWRCWCWRGWGGASPDLCIEKNNKCTRAWPQTASLLRECPLVAQGKQRKWCLLPRRLPTYGSWHAFTGQHSLLFLSPPRPWLPVPVYDQPFDW